MDRLLTICLYAAAVVAPAGVFAIVWPRGRQGEVGRIKRQSWTIATITILLCLLGLAAIFIVIIWAAYPRD